MTASAVIRLILVAVLLAACTPAAAPRTSSAPSAATFPYGSGDTALPNGRTAPPETPRPPPATDDTSTSVAPTRPAECDPYYGDCDDKYTPRPRPVTPRPPPNSGTVVGTSPDGAYLVDEDGLSLYTFANDSPGASTCIGGCAENWPPLAGERPLTQVDGAVAGTLSIIQRDNGTSQVTYNDAPLYHYSGDSGPGQTDGDGTGGVWYLAQP